MSVYLDHAATTPLRECALEAWTRAQRDLAAHPGNPAALHFGGRRARRMLDDAREQVAAALGADIHEVIFTSGATESDALGVMAASRGMRGRDCARDLIVVSGLEHDAVAHQREVASREGFSWEVLPVDAGGVSILPGVCGDDVPASWDGRLALGSMTLVSSEIGTIQPVADFAELVHASGGLVHSDAAQAIPTLDVSFAELRLDLMSVGGHKVGAPAGIGVLLARRGIPMTTDRPGGGHERSIRSGTPDVAGARPHRDRRRARRFRRPRGRPARAPALPPAGRHVFDGGGVGLVERDHPPVPAHRPPRGCPHGLRHGRDRRVRRVRLPRGGHTSFRDRHGDGTQRGAGARCPACLARP